MDHSYLRTENGRINNVIEVPQLKSHEASRRLARLVLTYPSKETKELVKNAFVSLGFLIKKHGLNAKDLDFLLEAVPDARSPYSWKYTPDRGQRLKKLEVVLEQLKNFNQVEDFDDNFAQYASDLDTWMTAIGYRGIGPSWVENTTDPSKNVKALLRAFKDHNYIVAALGEKEFPNRSKEDASWGNHEMAIRIPLGVQDKVEGETQGPQPGLPERLFTLDSYVAKGLAHGIPMRAHTSGSAPLTLAALQYVMNQGKKRVQPRESDLIKIAGVLCATYQLGDFHTLKETAAGISHFYQSYVRRMKFSNQGTKCLEDLTPKNFLGIGMGYLLSSLSLQAMSQFNWISSELMEIVTL